MVTALRYGTIWGRFSHVQFSKDTGGANDELVAADYRGLSTAFSISAMMYSAHMESVSIEQDMVQRQHYGRTLVGTQVMIGILYLSFGLLVYFFFGARDRATAGSLRQTVSFGHTRCVCVCLQVLPQVDPVRSKTPWLTRTRRSLHRVARE